MQQKTPKRPGRVTHKGRSADTGKSFDPLDLPEDAPMALPRPRAIPIGQPISQQEYKKLKEKAKKSNPLSRGNAQEDSAARKNSYRENERC